MISAEAAGVKGHTHRSADLSHDWSQVKMYLKWIIKCLTLKKTATAELTNNTTDYLETQSKLQIKY